MRVRDHLALSTAGAALLCPWMGRRVGGLWAGSVMIDLDHYVWFSVKRRRLSPAAAMRFFNEAQPPQDSATRALHCPIGLMAASLLGLRRRRLRPMVAGIGIHVALDLHHQRRMAAARAAALARDHYSCRGCGGRAPHVGTHLWRQPVLLPSYRSENLVSLCPACHERAHRDRDGAEAWS